MGPKLKIRCQANGHKLVALAVFFLCLELYFFAKAIEQWSANFYCKEPGSKHFMLCGPDGLVATTQFCCSRKTSTDV